MDERTRKQIIYIALHQQNDKVYMYLEKKKEEEFPALKIPWMHQYEDSKTISEREKKLQRSVAELSTQRQ